MRVLVPHIMSCRMRLLCLDAKWQEEVTAHTLVTRLFLKLQGRFNKAIKLALSLLHSLFKFQAFVEDFDMAIQDTCTHLFSTNASVGCCADLFFPDLFQKVKTFARLIFLEALTLCNMLQMDIVRGYGGAADRTLFKHGLLW